VTAENLRTEINLYVDVPNTTLIERITLATLMRLKLKADSSKGLGVLNGEARTAPASLTDEV
jgi:hypothetical protein